MIRSRRDASRRARGSAPAVEAEPDRPRITSALVRLFSRPRPNAGFHRHALGALACRPLRFEETCAAQLYQPPSEPAALRECQETEGEAAEAFDQACL